MSDPVSQTMKELFEKMAATLGAQQLSPSIQHPGNRTPVASLQSSYSSPMASQTEGEDRHLGDLSKLLDNHLRSLEKRALDPLRQAVTQLEKRCGRLEAMLAKRPETQTVTVDFNKPGNEAPSSVSIPGTYPTIRETAAPAAIVTVRPGEKLTRRKKKQAADLLSHLERIAPTATDYNALLSNKFVSVTASESRTRRETASSEVASSWSGGTSSDSDSDGGDNADYEIGAKYDPRDMPEDTGNQDRRQGSRPAVKKVDIDKDPAAIRTLEPRACHYFYLAKSGCARGADCHHGHHYRLSREHLKHMKQLVQQLPCKNALKTGVACPDGKDCIYPHKCPVGFNCHFGEKCRFFGIQGGHPYPGDFHTKQNYYDTKKEPKEETATTGWGAAEAGSSGVNVASSGW